MLGDGINDCVALRYADAGISVHTGANVAKQCADVILTKKELSIIVDSIIVGRTTQGNTLASSPLVSGQTNYVQYQIHQGGVLLEFRKHPQCVNRRIMDSISANDRSPTPHRWSPVRAQPTGNSLGQHGSRVPSGPHKMVCLGSPPLHRRPRSTQQPHRRRHLLHQLVLLQTPRCEQ